MNKVAKLRKLMARVVKQDNGCWEWQGAKSEGYGQIVIDSKVIGTHRLSYLIFKGELEKGMKVCHTCDNPPCCNPKHLFKGTTQDNSIDASKKGRLVTGEKHHNCTLTDEEVAECRRSYQAKRGDLKRLSKKYGVSTVTIRKIVRGEIRMAGVAEIDWIKDPVTEKATNLTGLEKGWLKVLGPAESIGRNGASLVRCRCGVEKVMMNQTIKHPKVVSCGCFARQQLSERVKLNPPRLGTGKSSGRTEQ